MIDVGVGIASYFLGPEIESFLGLGGDAAEGVWAGADMPADSFADYLNSVPTGIQGLSYRAGVQATTSVADGVAAAGGGLPAALGGMGAAQLAQQNAKKDARLNKKNCESDLSALGTTAAAVQQGLQNAQLINGATSNIPAASLGTGTPYAAGVSATYGTSTISQVMAANPNIAAMAQLGGNSIYINPAKWMMSDYFNNEFNFFHEVVAHNVAALPDQRAADAIHAKISKNSTSGISVKLGADCFGRGK